MNTWNQGIINQRISHARQVTPGDYSCWWGGIYVWQRYRDLSYGTGTTVSLQTYSSGRVFSCFRHLLFEALVEALVASQVHEVSFSLIYKEYTSIHVLSMG